MIRLNTRGVSAVINKMKVRKDKLASTAVANKKAAILMYQWVQKNFDAEGGLHSDSSLKWAPLAASTIRRRKKGSGTGRPLILQDTGNLRGRWGVSGTKQAGTVKSKQNYSSKHERGKAHVPKRKIFPTIKQAKEIVLPVYQHHVRISIK